MSALFLTAILLKIHTLHAFFSTMDPFSTMDATIDQTTYSTTMDPLQLDLECEYVLDLEYDTLFREGLNPLNRCIYQYLGLYILYI